MKRIATTILCILLVSSGARAESSCAVCGALIAPTFHCVSNCTTATAEVIEWGVVDDPVCITHCHLLPCLLFGNDACQNCDEYCAGGCDPSKSCRIRGRKRLMRKTLVEYIPVNESIVAPVCQRCLYQQPEAEAIPAPEGSPILAPLIDAADVQNSDVAAGSPVHWINSDTGPTAAGISSGQTGNGLERLVPASPWRALSSPRSSLVPPTTYPMQR